MKRIILITIIFVAVSNICFAENVKEEIIKLKSRIGGTMGITSTGLFSSGSSKSIFYNHTISNNFFLSFNAGHFYISGRFCFFGCYSDSSNNTYITVGINTITDYKIFNPYLGLGVGLLKREAHYFYSDYKKINNKTGIIVPTYGFFCKLYKGINLTGNVKGHYGKIEYYDEEYFGLYTTVVNIGLSFSF
jgi:hypothetical protein